MDLLAMITKEEDGNSGNIVPKLPELRSKLRKRKFKRRFRDKKTIRARKGKPINEAEWEICVSLWQSVIVQALYDAAGSGQSPERKLQRAEAFSWFSEKGLGGEISDFEMVCDLANMDPQKVIKCAKRVKSEGIVDFEGMNFRSLRKDVSSRVGRKAKSRRLL